MSRHAFILGSRVKTSARIDSGSSTFSKVIVRPREWAASTSSASHAVRTSSGTPAADFAGIRWTLKILGPTGAAMSRNFWKRIWSSFVNLGGGRCAVSAGRMPATAVASACSFGVGSIHERSNSQ